MKRKTVFKRILACCLAVILMLTSVPLSAFVGLDLSKMSEMFATRARAATNGKSQSEAVAWVRGKLGTQIGNGQCPALAREYYAYLGYSVRGSGKDYVNNVMPGWTKIPYQSGVVAQPGDVAVWIATNSELGKVYGHVAIVESGTTSTMTIFEQGASFDYKVSRHEIKYGQYGALTCLIRPDFVNDTSVLPSYTFDVNTYVNSVAYNSGHSNVTFDVYINGSCVANDVTDYYQTFAKGTTYIVNDIKVSGEYILIGNTSFSGTINSNVAITPQVKSHTHIYTSRVTRAATCTTMGEKTYTCSCGSSYIENIPLIAHNYITKDTSLLYLKSAATYSSPAVYYYKCSTCSAKGAETYTFGKELTPVTITYGNYPQSKITDPDIISGLSALSLTWNSFGWYSGNRYDGSMTAMDFGRYADVLYNGSKYRAVVFDKYRPYATSSIAEDTASDQYKNGYYTDKIYWFKYEPIKWRVLDSDSGLVMSEKILDSQAFQNFILENGYDEYGLYAFWGDKDKNYYSNNYYESSIRKWLNDDFYNIAFTTVQKNNIRNDVSIDNSASSSDRSYYSSKSSHDKIFLLSYNEVLDSAFGFSPSSYSGCSTRQAYGTDYAKANGLFVGNNSYSYWRLRTANTDSHATCSVDDSGRISDMRVLNYTNRGIRPVCRLKVIKSDSSISEKSCKHTYVKTPLHSHLKISATCYSKAKYHEYCSKCGCQSERAFESGTALEHIYTVKYESSEYLKSEATCTSVAEYYYKCARCSAKGTNTYTVGSKAEHSFTVKDPSPTYIRSTATAYHPATYYYKCATCSAKGTNYYNYGKNLDSILYGSYPQSRVSDNELITQLNKINVSWKSLNWYSGTGEADGKMSNGNFGRYKDVEFEGKKYRAINFSFFRPEFTYSSTNNINDYLAQSVNGYYEDRTYWFRYEPIKWSILDAESGLVISARILDSQAYHNFVLNYGKDEYNKNAFWGSNNKTYYSNNYYNSSIRKWLNNDFYNIAFTDDQKNNIRNDVAIDNSSCSIDWSCYNSKTSYDKIFLLSYEEVLSEYYGFSTSESTKDFYRRASGTDYSKCNGLDTRTGSVMEDNKLAYWWLRSASADYYDNNYSKVVAAYGDIRDIDTAVAGCGVRPACRLKVLESNVTKDSCWHTSSVIINAQSATCTADGYTGDRVCSICGETLEKGEIRSAPGHNVVVDKMLAATCTKTGLTEGKHCSACGKTITAQTVIPAKGHTESDWISDANGARHTECTVCHTVLKTEGCKHTDTKEVTVNPTCTKPGSIITVCELCGEKLEEKKTAPLGHKISTTVTPATLSKNGKTVQKCSVCGETVSTTEISRISKTTLSKTSYTYNGKVQKPAVSVKDSSGKALKIGTDYTVEYSGGCQSSGTYTVTVKFKGNYSGKQKLTYRIVLNAPAELKATRQKASYITLSWSKVSGATGYSVYQYNAKTKKYEKVASSKGNTATVKNLKAGKSYSFKVVALGKDNSLNSAFSKKITVGTSPVAPVLKAKSATKTAGLIWKKISGANSYTVYYSTKKNGTYKKLKTVKGNSYTAKKPIAGKTYYYKVVATAKIAGRTLTSGYSNIVKG